MTHTTDSKASVWQGDIVHLRRLREEDWQALYDARYDTVDERAFNGGVGNLHTARDYQQFIARLIETDAYAYAIENEEGDYCGTVRITHLDQRNGVYEMAVQVFAPFRGRGYARDAMRVLMRYAFHELRMNKANSVTIDMNQASRALHASLGFRQEGLRRENVYTDGAYRDEILFGITHAEFDALVAWPEQHLNSDERYMMSTTNPTLDALYARRSVRNYQARPVEHDKLVALLEAAMAAPSACNIQPWEFIVVTEPERVAAIKETIARWGNWNAPVIIAVCGVPDLIPWPGDDGRLDCAAAIENILVAAPSLGLGGVWVGGFNANAIRDVLGIPDEIVPVGLVYIGYPAEDPEPRTQYSEQAVHWEQYNAERKPAPREGRIV